MNNVNINCPCCGGLIVLGISIEQAYCPVPGTTTTPAPTTTTPAPTNALRLNFGVDANTYPGFDTANVSNIAFDPTNFVGQWTFDRYSQGPSQVDRGTVYGVAPAPTVLMQDFAYVYGSTSETRLILKCTPGANCAVRLYMGDTYGPTIGTQVSLGDGSVSVISTTQGGKTVTVVTGADADNNGLIELKIKNPNGYWVLNALDFVEGGAGNLPTAV